MKITNSFAVAVLACAVIAPAASATNLLVNGSFEDSALNPGATWTPVLGGSTDIVGWTTLLNGVDYMGGYWAAADGFRSIDLNRTNAGGISQSFETIIGEQYTVTFAMSGNMAGGPAEKIMQISAAGDSAIFTFNILLEGTTQADPKWRYHEWTFIADSSVTTLAFTSLITGGGWGPALDDVIVTGPIPAPGALALLGTFALMGGRRRR